MAPQQPYLHELSGVFAAPIQAWSGPDGQIRGTGAQGIYCADQRIISAAVLTVNGVEPDWVSTQLESAGRQRYLSVIRTEAPVADPLVSLTRTRTAAPDRVTEAFQIASALDEPQLLDVRLHLDADDSSMDFIKQGASSDRTVETSPDGWQWRGGDTWLGLAPGGASGVTATGGTVDVEWLVSVPANGTAAFSLAITARDAGSAMGAPASDPLPTPAAKDPRLNRLLRRAVSDLNALRLVDRMSPNDTFLAAGAPWFLTMFGRDSLITALLLLPLDTGIAGGTLRALARRQGQGVDAQTEEQPGKILHEVRRAATVHGGAGGMQLPPVYFGTIDATPLWIMLLHDAWRAGLPDAEVRALLPHLERALAWLRDYGDADGDGFLEYHDSTGHGLANQGWKDSVDSVRWHSGGQAVGPIALCEVQGYAYAAARGGAALLESFRRGHNGSGFSPDEWRGYARRLADRFRDVFWCRDANGPYPAIALDAAKRPVDGIASNMGHLLGTGILNESESAAVVARLMDPSMFSGYGVRTLSTTNGAYWPNRYHAGSVWTHDTAVISRGMLAAGYGAEARTLAHGLLAAAEGFGWQLPELFSGHGSDEVWPPVPYPASCRPQAWAAASAVTIAQVLGGLPAAVRLE